MSLEAKCLWGSVRDGVHPSVSGRQTKASDEDSKRPGTLAWDCPGHTPKHRKGLPPLGGCGSEKTIKRIAGNTAINVI